jgi:TPP-dependent indolepyruvate ferredoxin oxidoreductase alpha subunit
MVTKLKRPKQSEMIRKKILDGTFKTNLPKVPWNKGGERSLSIESRKKISDTLKRKGIKPPLSAPYISREKCYLWKDGRQTSRKIAIEDYKMNPNECQICKWLGREKQGKRIVIHHHNGNRHDNRRRNLCFICDFCHNAIHNSSKRGFWRDQTNYQHKPKLIEVTQ